MTPLLTSCGGFLLGVLWMDLLFDVQALGANPRTAVASIVAYYHRVTAQAYPRCGAERKSSPRPVAFCARTWSREPSVTEAPTRAASNLWNTVPIECGRNPHDHACLATSADAVEDLLRLPRQSEQR